MTYPHGTDEYGGPSSGGGGSGSGSGTSQPAQHHHYYPYQPATGYYPAGPMTTTTATTSTTGAPATTTTAGAPTTVAYDPYHQHQHQHHHATTATVPASMTHYPAYSSYHPSHHPPAMATTYHQSSTPATSQPIWVASSHHHHSLAGTLPPPTTTTAVAAHPAHPTATTTTAAVAAAAAAGATPSTATAHSYHHPLPPPTHPTHPGYYPAHQPPPPLQPHLQPPPPPQPQQHSYYPATTTAGTAPETAHYGSVSTVAVPQSTLAHPLFGSGIIPTMPGPGLLLGLEPEAMPPLPKSEADMIVQTLKIRSNGIEVSHVPIPAPVRRLSPRDRIEAIVSFLLRECLGVTVYTGCGHFVQSGITPIVHAYANWLDYPKRHQTIQVKTGMTSDLAMTQDGRYFYACACSTILCWDLTRNEVVQAWHARGPTPLVSVAVCLGRLATGCMDGDIILWDAHSEEWLDTLKGHTEKVNTVAFDKSGQRLISSSNDNTLCLWSVEKGECLSVFLGHSQPINCAMFIGSHTVVSGSRDRSIRLWNSETGRRIRSVVGGVEVINVAINCDFTLLACATVSQTTMYSWPDMKIKHTLSRVSRSIEFHPMNPHILAGFCKHDCSVIVIDVRKELRRHVFSGLAGNVRDLWFTPDGSRLISLEWSLDGNPIKVWDLTTPQTR